MSTPGTEQGERRSASTFELLRSLTADVKTLILGEAELAGQELKAKATETRSAAVLLGAGLLIASLSVLTLTAAAVLVLALAMPAWLAATVVGVLLVVTATVLLLLARTRFRRAMPLTPREAIDAAKEDAEWIRTRTEELKNSG